MFHNLNSKFLTTILPFFVWYFRFNESTERLIESGQKLNVDLAYIPDYYYQRFPMFRDFKYITTLGI